MIAIHTIEGGLFSTNCYIITKDSHALLIDYVPEASDFIRKNKLTADKILITHIHFDHITGLSDFQKENDFEIALSENGLKNINDPSYNLTIMIPSEIREKIKNIDLKNAKTYKTGDVIEWLGISVKTIEAPGHSNDSLVFVIDSEKTAFTGDVIFNLSIGRTDFHNGDFETLIKSIQNLYKYLKDDYRLYPGHGTHTIAGYEKQFNPFFQNRI